MAWYSYAYALIIYDRLGMGAERAFATQWGIALGIDNALQARQPRTEAFTRCFFSCRLRALSPLCRAHIPASSPHRSCTRFSIAAAGCP